MRKLFLLVPAILVLAIAAGQKAKTPAAAPSTDNADEVLMSKLKYRLVGPFRGGRSGAVTGSYTSRTTFYFGGTGGGVWKTQDGGNNWKNISDKFLNK